MLFADLKNGTQVDDLNLSELVEKIRKEAGFEVSVHARGRTDLNDWDADLFTRSKPRYHQTKAVYNRKIRERYIFSLEAVNGAIGGHISRDQRELNVVAYGKLPRATKKIVEEETQGYHITKYVEAFGRILLSYQKYIKPVKNSVERTFYEGVQKLCDVIKTESTVDAHYVQLTIPAKIREGFHDAGFAGVPVIAFFGTQELTQEIVKYLANNPGQYNEFIEQILPEEKFPKVYGGIVKKMNSNDKLVFLNTDEFNQDNPRKRSNYNFELAPWVYSHYGEFVNF
ncbi:hypothetical protein HN587_00045 [Candidatus Woesearchaeota archaeon]|jgi:hypothetical protein|nr:hypothetical protein [Candidatus Woesearchaeota archaeon]